jgi:regulator of sirC expression with transglutaminase-like and TPR domain
MAHAGGAPREMLAALAAAGDDAVSLGTTALIIANLEQPGKRLDDYIGHFDALSESLKREEFPAALAAWRGEEHDDDDRGLDLMAVLDDGRGAGEALGILAIEAGRRAGLDIEGLAFAPRFLLRLGDEHGERVIIDPAAGWCRVEPPGMRALLKAASGLAAELAPAHYQRLSNRDILVRLQTQAKLRRLRRGAVGAALAAVEATLLFAPDRALLWREAGLMNMRLGRLAEAVAALEQFQVRSPNPLARRRAAQLVQELKDRMR